MTNILGISAYYHDSAAALVVDGHIVAAAQEERFTRRKHDAGFPQQAVDYCLSAAHLQPEDLDYVGFYDKPLDKFARLLETYLAYVPRGYRSFRRALPPWLRQKLHLPRELRRGLYGRYRGRFIFSDHHQSHAASAFYPSPFDEAAILTLDGVGEWSTLCMGIGRGNRIELSQHLQFPHSLGMLYSAFTHYIGYRVNSGEYKLMGLAAYGQPVYRDLILDHLIDLKSDGSFRLDMSYFNYATGLTMTSRKLQRLLGAPPRKPESEITQREKDLAASIQSVTEEVVLRCAHTLHRQSGLSSLVLAGGVALNCVANGRLLREGPFEKIWIQPAAGDAGGALGVALFVWHQLLGNSRQIRRPDGQHGSLLGPSYDAPTIAAVLDAHSAHYYTCQTDVELCELVSELIADGMVVGWFQGRMEFGPRALGSRSILADARSAHMQATLNQKIKFRESFRPFAPIVLSECAEKWFDLPPGHESPYMLLTAPVRPESLIAPSIKGSESLIAPSVKDHTSLTSPLCSTPFSLNSPLPAITHVDYSARLQTVDRLRNPLLHQLLSEFQRQTLCPVMINTSFNVRGEPIVCNPDEAYRCFMMTDIDVLVLGRHVMLKSDQTPVTAQQRSQHLAQFQLD